MLDLEIDVESLLPPDDMSQGFDNMADVLTVSPTLLESYISAAGKISISRLAVGDPGATPAVETYGTRGGTAVRHNFPADGEYVIRLSLYFRSLGPLFGDNKPAEGEQIEGAVNGERVALFDIDRKMKVDEDLRTPGSISRPARRRFPLRSSLAPTGRFKTSSCRSSDPPRISPRVTSKG